FVNKIYENYEAKSGEAKCEFVQIYPLSQICEILAKGRLNLSEIWMENLKNAGVNSGGLPQPF
ncbi:hypothetical protein, partial [Campylobacter sp.]|uniref:hypothetical protein n=1 Tax=Campylobacter sp. TaxID=205 RepID=UPI0036230BBC